jgi:hypothetical protein
MATERKEPGPTNDRTGKNPTNKADKVTNKPTRVTNAGPEDERNEPQQADEERRQPQGTTGATPGTRRPGEDDRSNNPNAIDRGSDRTPAGKGEEGPHGEGRYQNTPHHSGARGTTMDRGRSEGTTGNDSTRRKEEEEELRASTTPTKTPQARK